MVKEIARSRRERPWCEFKVNNDDPEEIGRLISAISNVSAAMGRTSGLVAWGVNDDGQIVGTSIDPWTKKIGNEDLIPWLRVRTQPDGVGFRFHKTELEGHRLVLLEIDAAFGSPTQFSRQEYVRRETYVKLLSQCPTIAADLWASFNKTPFEKRVCREGESIDSVMGLLAVDAYRDILGRPATTVEATLSYMESDGLIARNERSGWDITNLGALCFARRLEEFDLDRKCVRFVRYAGNDRTQAVDAYDGKKGYVVGFAGLIEYIEAQLPKREVTDISRRWEENFPKLAVRELMANALIHQDLSRTGSGPMVELFSDRLDITNPGAPLANDTRRLLDWPPESRNEDLAGIMRLADYCEERGSGIDKVARETEAAGLPAPDIRVVGDSTVATLLGPRELSRMSAPERNLVTYMHASLKWVSKEPITNTTVRARFGIPQRSAARASKLLNDAVEAGLIQPQDPAAGRGQRKYVPFWAEDPAADFVLINQ